MTQPFVFLDKDGTLIDDVPYNVDPTRVRLAHGAPEALRLLRDAGFRLAVITNQPGIARGLFSESAFADLAAYLSTALKRLGVCLDGVYYCPHDPAGVVPSYAVDCFCRKPKPGLILRAARELRADLKRSWFIGDILNDVEAGKQAGCRTVLLDNGNETEWRQSRLRVPDALARDLPAAARLILDHSIGWRRRRGFA